MLWALGGVFLGRRFGLLALVLTLVAHTHIHTCRHTYTNPMCPFSCALCESLRPLWAKGFASRGKASQERAWGGGGGQVMFDDLVRRRFFLAVCVGAFFFGVPSHTFFFGPMVFVVTCYSWPHTARPPTSLHWSSIHTFHNNVLRKRAERGVGARGGQIEAALVDFSWAVFFFCSPDAPDSWVPCFTYSLTHTGSAAVPYPLDPLFQLT